ncbi:MAG: ppsA, partial [Armatimonadetes bacterium]|nr:ppsA [Armatimonadota bacterium]
MRPVLSFEQISPGDLPLVGGKALNLGRLTRAGLPVPVGFVVTTDAYRAPQDPEVAAAVTAAYRDLGGGLVAARSSATAEDLEGASFAGQQETLLGVSGEAELLDAVRRCWESLFTPRAVAYRRANAIPDASVAMAVVVQRMVAAEAAGVLFTRDPSDSSAGHMLVEGAWGLGEAVVSGRVTPDRWRLDRTSGAVLEAVVSFKPVMVVAGAEVPATRQGEPCLTAGQLQRLVQLARRIEAEYGAPQDVEWAVLGEEVWLLQSRSITAT